MKHRLICQLEDGNRETILHLFDATKAGKELRSGALYTELPEPIETAIQNEELMAQLGESIVTRITVSNGIEV